MSIYQRIVSLANDVPPGVWVAVVVANIGLTVLSWGVAKRRLRRAGERAVHPERFTDSSRKKDTALTIASLVPAALFWGMVTAVSRSCGEFQDCEGSVHAAGGPAGAFSDVAASG